MLISIYLHEWSRLFKESYLDALSALGLNAVAMRLFALLGLGDYGAYSQSWIENLKQLGCLHLLVLSGTQANSFAALLGWNRGVWQCFPNPWGRVISNVIVALMLTLYGVSIGWPPPLARGILTCLILALPWRISKMGIVAVALLLQVAIFPQHLGMSGFYLSWISSLILMLSADLRLHSWARRIFQTTFCTLLIYFGMALPNNFVQSLLLAVLANAVLGPVFESLLQPFVSLLLGMATLGLGLKLAGLNGVWIILVQEVSVFLRPFFASLVDTLLVALRGIRYIQ